MRRILTLILIAALASVPKVGALAPETRVRLEPAEVAVGLHETFAVQVMIEGTSDLGAFEFDLTYDPSILRAEEATVGDFLGSTGRSVVPVGPEVDSTGGRMTLGAISYGSRPGPSGTGVLATITFVARREGSTALELSKVQVLDTAANAQSVTVAGGRVVVSGAAAPAPAATATPRPTGTPTAVATPTPPATPLPSPTPSLTAPPAETPTPEGTRWIVLGPLLVVLAAIILAALILRRRSEGLSKGTS